MFFDENKNGSLVAIVVWHADDFMIGGYTEHPKFKGDFDYIKSLYDWGDWESERFDQCGVPVEQFADCSIRLNQHRYLQELEPLPASKARLQRGASLAV